MQQQAKPPPGSTAGPPPAFSIIVPVFREEANIRGLIEHVASLEAPGGSEIVIVDGSPGQETLAVVPEGAALRVESDKGRGRQMNAGARAARGEVLLFLHADTRLPPGGLRSIREALSDGSICGGAFSLRIDSHRPALRLIGHVANLRSRCTRVPYGDQAIFVRRRDFEALGGFIEAPIMEDLEFMRRVRRSGRRVRILDAEALTSARRWDKEGVWRCTARNLLLRLLFRLGVSPQRLARFYR